MLTAHSQLPLLSQHAAEGQDLTPSEIEQALHDLLEPQVPLEVKAEFLLCLARKGETPREIAGFAILLRELAANPGIDPGALGGKLLDTCGTGADGVGTFNVSTAVALVLAAAGIPVAKHGNRAITSRCGSADVLEALGVNIEMPAERMKEALETLHIGFLFAPQYHKAFKILRPVREHLARQGHRTIFNLLGPLVNPARPNIQIVGVCAPELTETYIQVLSLMKLKRAVAVHGFTADRRPCMDEFSTLGPSRISQLHSNGAIEHLELDAAAFGFTPPSLEELKGGDAMVNAKIIRHILDGADTGPRRDLVVFNAAAGFVLAGKAPDMAQGVRLAAETVSSGAAGARLREFSEFSRRR